MAKRTLYITFDGLSDSLGQSQILPYVTGIAANGYHITILSCEKKESLAREQPKIEQLLKTHSISWRYVLYDEAGGFLSRMKYLRELSLMAEDEYTRSKFQLLHCRSYLAALIGLRFRRKYNVPFLFDMRGLWADERLEGNIWSRNNPLHRLAYVYFKRKEKQFLREADAVVSLTQAALDHLDEKFPNLRLSKKTSVIPCCVDTSLFDPSARELSGIEKEEHLLIYTGSIGTWYYTKEMIDFVVELRKVLPSAKLLIVTRDLPVLDQILKSYTPEERMLITSRGASYTEIPSLLARAKASIFFIKPSFSKIASSPTKMAECWAMNLPIITNSGIGDNDMYFLQKNGGVLVDAFTKEAYAKSIKSYMEYLRKNNSCRDIAIAHFNKSTAIQTYSAIYDRLTGN